MSSSSSLEAILAHIESFQGSLPPVAQWSPQHDADMDLVITRDGRWVHEGGVIERESLRKLLASVLRREDDGRYALVTPGERVFIQVEDVPFLIVDWEILGEGAEQQLSLESNFGELTLVDQQNPLWLTGDEPSPCVFVRPGLSGRLTRAAYYRLADVLEEREGQWGLSSGGFFNVLSP